LFRTVLRRPHKRQDICFRDYHFHLTLYISLTLHCPSCLAHIGRCVTYGAFCNCRHRTGVVDHPIGVSDRPICAEHGKIFAALRTSHGSTPFFGGFFLFSFSSSASLTLRVHGQVHGPIPLRLLPPFPFSTAPYGTSRRSAQSLGEQEHSRGTRKLGFGNLESGLRIRPKLS
jgi:hypothetical protein